MLKHIKKKYTIVLFAVLTIITWISKGIFDYTMDSFTVSCTKPFPPFPVVYVPTCCKAERAHQQVETFHFLLLKTFPVSHSTILQNLHRNTSNHHKPGCLHESDSGTQFTKNAFIILIFQCSIICE